MFNICIYVFCVFIFILNMILTNRARKKIQQYNVKPEDILTVIESGEEIIQPERDTVPNGSGGQRLLTYKEKHNTTILKRIEGLHVRFKPNEILVIDVYMSYRSQRRNHDVVLETSAVEASALAQ